MQNLLSYAFHKTVTEIFNLKLPQIITDIFSQDPVEYSVDLLLVLLNIIEMLAANVNYRKEICENKEIIKNLGTLLMVSFAS